MKRLTVLAWLIVACPLWADDLKIRGEIKVPAYRLVELSPLGAEPDAAILWDVFPEEAADIREQNGSLLFVAPPGVYKVKLRTIKGQKVQAARVTVTIDPPPGPVPPPVPVPPDPVPVPTPPTPTPKADKLWLIVLDSPDTRTGATARVLGDLAFWQGLGALGHRWRFMDRASQEATDKGYVAAAGAVSPALLVLDSAGKVLKSAALPADTAGVRAIVTEVTGR